MIRFTKPSSKTTKQNQRGLTLFELLVVLVILALLATLVAPRVVGYLGRAKTDIAKAQASNIAASLELFYLDFGRYPDQDEGLQVLVTEPAGDGASQWRGPYFKEETGLIDPWGRGYIYVPDDNGEAFTIKSLGRDGEEGGDGDDADVSKR
ncbi:MAG: type II secretion system protein GspG [Hyphococcus sp.]|nr:MAG: type II secretion system protein GspG [Marinicaulis sp.]